MDVHERIKKATIGKDDYSMKYHKIYMYVAPLLTLPSLFTVLIILLQEVNLFIYIPVIIALNVYVFHTLIKRKTIGRRLTLLINMACLVTTPVTLLIIGTESSPFMNMVAYMVILLIFWHIYNIGYYAKRGNMFK